MIHGMLALWAIGETSGFGDMAAQAFEGLQRDRPDVDSTRLMLIAAGFLAVMVLVGLLCCFSESHRKPAACHSPWRLFFSLAKAHRLGILDVWILWRAARAHQLEDPARLFLEPERLDPAALPRRLGRQASRLESLRSRLFADLKSLAEATRGP